MFWFFAGFRRAFFFCFFTMKITFDVVILTSEAMRFQAESLVIVKNRICCFNFKLKTFFFRFISTLDFFWRCVLIFRLSARHTRQGDCRRQLICTFSSATGGCNSSEIERGPHSSVLYLWPIKFDDALSTRIWLVVTHKKPNWKHFRAEFFRPKIQNFS